MSNCPILCDKIMPSKCFFMGFMILMLALSVTAIFVPVLLPNKGLMLACVSIGLVSIINIIPLAACFTRFFTLLLTFVGMVSASIQLSSLVATGHFWASWSHSIVVVITLIILLIQMMWSDHINKK